MARKASGACPVNLKVSKSQNTHALYLLSHGFFSGSRVSGNHVGHSTVLTVLTEASSDMLVPSYSILIGITVGTTK